MKWEDYTYSLKEKTCKKEDCKRCLGMVSFGMVNNEYKKVDKDCTKKKE